MIKLLFNCSSILFHIPAEDFLNNFMKMSCFFISKASRKLGFPILYARAQDLAHLLDLKKAGATDAILENAEVL